MKSVIGLLSLLAVTSTAHASACTDFSGVYQGSDEVTLTVVQVGCDSAKFSYKGPTETFINPFTFDGVLRKTALVDGVTNFEAATFRYGEFIAIEGENHFMDKVMKYERKVSLVENRTLLDEIGHYANDGTFIHQTQAVYVRK